jgi:hypothetical protein
MTAWTQRTTLILKIPFLHSKEKIGKVSYIHSYGKRRPSGCLLTKLDIMYTEDIFVQSFIPFIFHISLYR